jgi:predicted N-acetyltransferase YhbS
MFSSSKNASFTTRIPYSLGHKTSCATDALYSHSLSLIIRAELPEDLAAIREVNRRAFNQDQEANLVDALRSNGAALLSLVAILDGQVVGHIMYSPATIGTDPRSEPTRDRVSNAAGTGEGVTGAEVTGAGLAPMAVLPEHQRHGIGSKLKHPRSSHHQAAIIRLACCIVT